MLAQLQQNHALWHSLESLLDDHQSAIVQNGLNLLKLESSSSESVVSCETELTQQHFNLLKHAVNAMRQSAEQAIINHQKELDCLAIGLPPIKVDQDALAEDSAPLPPKLTQLHQ